MIFFVCIVVYVKGSDFGFDCCNTVPMLSTTFQDEITEAESRVYEAEKAAILAANQADKLRQNLVELQLRVC